MADFPVTVWTALLQDDGQGWVLGVFSTKERAVDVIEQYIRGQGGSPLWLNDPDTLPGYLEASFGDDSDDRIIVTDYLLDVGGS